MKTIFSEEELSIMEALEIKGGRLNKDKHECHVALYCPEHV